MGSSPSKPSADSQHVFQAGAPIRFSEGLVDSLQRSTDSDSTRAKNIELQIQQRVQEELQKLQKAADEKLSAASEKVSNEPRKPAPQPKKKSTPSPSSGRTATWTEKPLLNRISETIFGSGQPDDKPQFNGNLDRSAVAKEIDELKRKFETRRQIVDLDKDIAKAKEDVVTCLRLNDRRPLDCWKEVETFKTEVARLERAFVEKNGS